jgi:hypothetical protein
VAELLHVEILHKTHLYWPDLDVDLAVDSLTDPGKFPLVYHNAT